MAEQTQGTIPALRWLLREGLQRTAPEVYFNQPQLVALTKTGSVNHAIACNTRTPKPLANNVRRNPGYGFRADRPIWSEQIALPDWSRSLEQIALLNGADRPSRSLISE